MFFGRISSSQYLLQSVIHIYSLKRGIPQKHFPHIGLAYNCAHGDMPLTPSKLPTAPLSEHGFFISLIMQHPQTDMVALVDYDVIMGPLEMIGPLLL